MYYVVGLSGGVDSAVCAAILKSRGYRVAGVYLDGGFGSYGDARDVAGQLGIDFEAVDISRDMKEKVIEPFLNDYKAGLTPNPCINCNPGVKFKTLVGAAHKLGADRIATGHYAVVRDGGLYKGLPGRDQSYMLYRMPEEWLCRIEFPLGSMDKGRVRGLAREYGIHVASKKDSMDVCFPYTLPERVWTLKDENGAILGEQTGFFTIGQRRGLGVASYGRLYVCGIDAGAGIVTLGGPESVSKTRFSLGDVHMLAETDERFDCLARIRHAGSETEAAVELFSGGRAALEFKAPVFGGAPGQSAVFYKNDRVLGGGVIG